MARKLLGIARTLREHATDAETLFWNRVRGRQIAGRKFRRQLIVDAYIVDFVCVEARLIIELDGGQHDGSIEDVERDTRLLNLGYRVLRFWNHDVLSNIDGVLSAVAAALDEER